MMIDATHPDMISSRDEKLCVREEDAIRLILEFLSRRDLSISQLNLERESGIYNCNYSDDLIFLRQLILDGQWDDALQFVSPLESFETFSSQRFRFIIYKHKYVELLCIRSEASLPYQTTVEVAVQDIIECLDKLDKYCSDRDEYNHLSSLLTIPDLSDDDELKNWNPNSWRLKCFKDVLPLVDKFMPSNNEDESGRIAKNDRLMDLIFKGLLYEVCLHTVTSKISRNLEEMPSEIHSFEPDVFNGINEKMNLNNFLLYLPDKYFVNSQSNNDSMHLDIAKHEKPELVASWSEMILSAPIKPKVFPHIDVPYTRIKAADLMSKSLSASLMHHHNTKDLMTMSVRDIAQFTCSTLAASGFHLENNNQNDQVNNEPKIDRDNSMNKSIDRLFQNRSKIKPTTEMSPINEITTPNEELPSDPQPSDIVSTSTNNDGLMSTSYFQIWKNHQKERNHHNRLAINNQSNQISKTPSSKPPLAIKNREESNKLVRHSSMKTKSTCAIRNNHIHNLIDTCNNSINNSCSYGSSNQLLQQQSISTKNQFTTPKVSTKGSGNMPKMMKPLMTSTPKDRLQHHLHIKPEPFEDIEDVHQFQHYKQNFSFNSPSSFTDLRSSELVNVAGNQKFNNSKHGIHRTSPITNPDHHFHPHQHHHEHHFDREQQSQIDLSNSTGNNNIILTGSSPANDIHFIPTIKIRDQQAIRTADFHPSGKYYAVGSNSKLLRIFRYNSSHASEDGHNKPIPSSSHHLELEESEEILAKPNYHKGSIYCLTWNKLGNLLATGSNDKTVKILPFNQEMEKFSSNPSELNFIHDGTVRDMCFMDDLTNGSSLLLSGGAGDCKVYITDCETSQTFLSLSGHSGPILSMYTWGGAMFVSGSQDRTIRFWDLRSNSCINFVTCPTISRTRPGGAVAAVCVDPSGKLLVSGHEDSTCMLYDIRGGRVIQTFHPHQSDIRTIRFSSKAYYLLTGGYDNNIVLTDLQGDLTQPLQNIVVASHQDKVIQCRWHPSEFTFLSTSADKSVMVWTLPE